MREDLGDYSQWKKCMYVAAMSIDCDVTKRSPEEYLKMGWVAFFEYEAFSKYAKAGKGQHPLYNKR